MSSTTQEPRDKVKIRAVCSIPRIGWNDAWQTIVDSLKVFDIPITTFNGVFWGQCMQRACEEAVADGIDWLLTLDYDSMILPSHVNDLLRHFGENPEIDALASLQMRRGQDFPLMTQSGQTQLEITGEPVPVHSAHFGLTLIRVDKLKSVPKPWFYAKPDDNGEWSDDRLDDDIWFWHQWRLAGNTVYVAPDVRIGHLELVVSGYSDDYKPEHLHIGSWHKRYRGASK